MFEVGHLTTVADSSADARQFYDTAVHEGWTEGLPVARPGSSRVGSFASALGWDAGQVIGQTQGPDGAAWSVTLGQLAGCCVMAGCLPEHGPVVRAAAEAILTPEFRLGAIRDSGGAIAPLVIVSGAAVSELGFANGHGLFAGGGARPNMAVGRAIALLVHNLFGPDRAPDLGGPNLFMSCIAEYTDRAWEPVHVSRGFPDARSGVTVIAASTHNGQLLTSMNGNSGKGLEISADGLRTLGNLNTQDLGGEAVVCLSQPNMEVLEKDGWSRRNVQDFLFQKARRTVGELRRAGIISEERLARWRAEGRRIGYNMVDNDDELLPVVDDPESLIIVPCGGETMWWSCVVHGTGKYGGRAVTKPIAAR